LSEPGALFAPGEQKSLAAVGVWYEQRAYIALRCYALPEKL
jgi:hypothetical protein